MKMKKIIATIYWVYKSKKHEFPYLATILTVVGLTFLHLCQILLLFGIPSDVLFPIDMSNAILRRWFNASVVLTPLIILFVLFFKKKTLLSCEIDEKRILRGKRIIPVYFFVTLLLLALLLIRDGIKRGFINF